MKTTTVALAAHLGEDTTTLAVLWKATRRDGSIFGFTTHDEDIAFDDGSGEVLYLASTGFTNTAADTKSDLSVDNMDVAGFLDSEAITEDDIRAGLWRDSVVDIFVVNWADPTMGHLKIRRGTTGIIKTINGQFVTEIRGLTNKLTTVIGAAYGPICRAELGSGTGGIDTTNHYLCNKDISLYAQTGAVSDSPDAVTIVPSAGLVMRGSATPSTPAPEGWFNDGILKFLDGPLADFWIEIKSWDGTTLTTFLPMPSQPEAGNTFTIEPGCSHLITDCKQKFDNVVNFRGEPNIPGLDLITKYPNAK